MQINLSTALHHGGIILVEYTVLLKGVFSLNLRLYVLDMGSMCVDLNVLLNGAVKATSLEPAKPNQFIQFPIPAFLLETECGYILYDTGCHPKCMGPDGCWPMAVQERAPFTGSEECNILYRLKELGLTPKDISTVILSHMHSDHAGGLEYFTSSKIIVHRDEFLHTLLDYATHNYLSGYIWNETNTWIKHKMQWELVDNDDDMLKVAPGVTILNFGSGHAHGLLGLMVELKNTGRVLLTSDACYFRDSYEGKKPGDIYDSLGWQRTVKRIHRMADETNATVWFGHDEAQFRSLKKSTDGYYD